MAQSWAIIAGKTAACFSGHFSESSGNALSVRLSPVMIESIPLVLDDAVHCILTYKS